MKFAALLVFVVASASFSEVSYYDDNGKLVRVEASVPQGKSSYTPSDVVPSDTITTISINSHGDTTKTIQINRSASQAASQKTIDGAAGIYKALIVISLISLVASTVYIFAL